jgi:hypothetical protein
VYRTPGRPERDDGTASDPLGTVRRRARVRDLAALAAVPLVLVVVGALPDPTRESLLFRYGDPTLVTAFTAHYVHFTAGHLLGNVALYLLVVPLAYTLAVASGERRRFAVAATTFLLAFPVVLSALNLAVPRPGVAAGFSGINAAFVGYLAVALPGYLDRFAPDRGALRSPWLFFFGLAAIALVAVQTSVRVAAVGVAAFLSGVLFLLPAVERGDRLAALFDSLRVPGGLELGLVGFVVFAAYPLVAFRSAPVVDGRVINTYAHLLGFALGYIATYVTALVETRVRR